MASLEQTPVHERHNPDLLSMIPSKASSLIEVGCSSGALAREYKKSNNGCFYAGIEISEEFSVLASRYCDHVYVMDMNEASEEFYSKCQKYDCWIFGDSLEHFVNPWNVLEKVRSVMPQNGCVVASIPNVQHWSVLATIASGEFPYQDSGLFDKTHLRWFTRKTIITLFDATGFQIVEGISRVFEENGRDLFLPILQDLANASGSGDGLSLEDFKALQYVVRAVPK